MTSKIFISFVLLLLSKNQNSQSQFSEFAGNSSDKRFSVSASIIYVSSATVQPDLDNPDPFLSSSSYVLDGSFGYGGEIMYSLPIDNFDIKIFFAGEYYNIKQNSIPVRFANDTLHYTISSSDEITMYPFEFGVKWELPQFFQDIVFYIGGGGGFYTGNRKKNISGFSSETLDKSTGFSLNVLTGAEYIFGRNISLNLELKFREPYFDIESKYNLNTININGTDFELKTPVKARVTVDGVRLSLGLNFHF